MRITITHMVLCAKNWLMPVSIVACMSCPYCKSIELGEGESYVDCEFRKEAADD